MQRSDEVSSILRRIEEIGRNLRGRRLLSFTPDERTRMRAEEEALLLEYVEHLTYAPVSRCPHCQAELEIAMDTGGLDGPWWWLDCPVALPPHRGCEHFRTFLGAMDLHGRSPSEVEEGVVLGPGAPFVVSRLLRIETMKAVLAGFTMPHDDTAFIVAYFSEAPVHQSQLHQEWRKRSYPLYDDSGVPVATESKFDAWDFDIEPWIRDGRLFWIGENDPTLTLKSDLPCPYANLQGTRKQQVLGRGKVELVAAPADEENALYERP